MSLPSSLSNLTALNQLRLSDNHFDMDIGQLQLPVNVETVLLRNNRFTGSLALVSLPPSVKLLTLAHNRLTSVDTDACNSQVARSDGTAYTGPMLNLTLLFLPNNLISMPLASLVRCLANAAPFLSAMDVSGNAIHGDVQLQDLYVVGAVQDSQSIGKNTYDFAPGLYYLVLADLGQNQLTGQNIIATFSSTRSLEVLDLSQNALEGSIPEDALSLNQLDVHDNPLLVGVKNTSTPPEGEVAEILLPSFLQFDTSSMQTNDTLRMMCPAVVGVAGQRCTCRRSTMHFKPAPVFLNTDALRIAFPARRARTLSNARRICISLSMPFVGGTIPGLSQSTITLPHPISSSRRR